MSIWGPILLLWQPTWILFFLKRRRCNSVGRRTYYSCLVSLITGLESSLSFGYCGPLRKPGFDSGVPLLRWGLSGKKERGICGACGTFSTVRPGAAGIANLLPSMAEG